MPTWDLDVPTVELWTLLLSIPVGDQCTFIRTKKIDSSCIVAGGRGMPPTNLGQGIDFPTVILRCLYESFRLIRVRFTSP